MLVQQSITNYFPPHDHPQKNIRPLGRNRIDMKPPGDIIYHWRIANDRWGSYVVGTLDDREWETSYINRITNIGKHVIQITTRHSTYYLPICSRMETTSTIHLP